jgi:hypothetical protein
MTMHGEAAKIVDFLRDQDESFIANIVPQLMYRTYPAESIIYCKGDIADEIYFMFKGKVNYVIG